MAALIAERSVSRKGAESTGVVPVITVGVKTNIKIYKGSFVAIDATGYAIAGAGIAATGLKVVGIATKTVDATGISSGVLTLDVQRGVFPFTNLGGDPLAQADFGNTCFVDDDQTVRKTSNTSTRSNAGIFLGFDESGTLALVQVGNFSQTGV
jgi:hypothetical protein